MTDSSKKPARDAVDVAWRRTQLGFAQFLDAAAPWLLELGSWIFGALIAFNLVILGVVLTIGPVDVPVRIATAAFALALPPNVVGFVLLRLVADIRKIRLRDTATKAFVDVGFKLDDSPEADVEKAERRMSSVTLVYTYGLLTLTLLLTLIGVTSALWHSAWWIGLAFLAMLAVSLGVLVMAASQLGGDERWSSPSGDEEPPQKS